MAEAANPATGANQEPPSVEERMANFLVQYDKEQTEPPPEQDEPTAAPAERQAQQPQEQAPTDELTPDDLPETEAQASEQPPSTDTFEIVHDGQQRKLTREETIKYAQQGFDYSQKMHAVAEKDRQAQQRLAQVQQVEQLTQMLAPDLAVVKSLEAQLEPFKNVDWVRLANEAPQDYPRYRAQFDVLVNSFNQAVGALQQKGNALQQHKHALTEQTVQQQRAKLLERMPAWRDEARYKQAVSEIMEYAPQEGVDPNALAYDAGLVTMAYKAAQYDKLQRAKSAKVKQLQSVPPVTRPGASQGQGQVKAERQQKLSDRLKRTCDQRDAMALLMERMK